MPSGGVTPISAILKAVCERRDQVHRVFDIGIGFGKYGVLLREYLELWDGREKHRKDDWLRTIDGIEVNEEYIGPLQRYVYNRIFIGEALSVMANFHNSSYDLLLAADVLEHFKKPKGFDFLKEALRISTWVLVSVPRDAQPYRTGPFDLFGRPWGNRYEIHRSHWAESDFLAILPHTLFLPCEDYIIASMESRRSAEV